MLADSADALRVQDHVEYYSLQALLFKRKGLSYAQQTMMFYSHRRRICG